MSISLNKTKNNLIAIHLRSEHDCPKKPSGHVQPSMLQTVILWHSALLCRSCSQEIKHCGPIFPRGQSNTCSIRRHSLLYYKIIFLMNRFLNA